MAKTQGTLITNIRQALDEPTTRFWSDDEVRRWINEAARDIARRTESLEDRDTVTLTADVQEYTLAADILRVHRVEYTRDGDTQTRFLEYRDFNAMDEIWWNQKIISTGDPQLYTLWGFVPSLKIVLYPTPDNAGDIIVYSYRLPAALSETTTSDAAVTVECPEGWEDLIIQYAMYLAFLKDSDPRWQNALQVYEQRMQEMMDLTRRHTDQAGMVTNYLGSQIPEYIWNWDY